jgi:hypothetical protein
MKCSKVRWIWFRAIAAIATEAINRAHTGIYGPLKRAQDTIVCPACSARQTSRAIAREKVETSL